MVRTSIKTGNPTFGKGAVCQIKSKLLQLIRPVLIFLTLPATILTLGLFIFVINALLFWLVAEMVPGFKVSGFMAALIGSFMFSVISMLTSWVIPDAKPAPSK